METAGKDAARQGRRRIGWARLRGALWLGLLAGTLGGDGGTAGEPEWSIRPQTAATQSPPTPTTEPAADSGQLAVAKLWERFTSHLRRGELAQAYACYSQPSRQRLSFDAFRAQHHPLTSYGQAILQTPLESRFDVRGEKAILTLLPSQQHGHEAMEIRFFMVRESGQWALVHPLRWPLASVEADARKLIRALHARFAAFVADESNRLHRQAFRAAHADLFAAPLYQRLDTAYHIRIVATDAQDWAVQLVPRPERSDLRGFTLDRAGHLQATPAAETAP